MCYQILSRDSVTVSVDAVVYFNVIDPEQALCSVDDFRLDRWSVGRSARELSIWPPKSAAGRGHNALMRQGSRVGLHASLIPIIYTPNNCSIFQQSVACPND